MSGPKHPLATLLWPEDGHPKGVVADGVRGKEACRLRHVAVVPYVLEEAACGGGLFAPRAGAATLATWWVGATVPSIVLAVVLAFGFGYSLTMLPVLRSGMTLRCAIGVAVAADTSAAGSCR